MPLIPDNPYSIIRACAVEKEEDKTEEAYRSCCFARRGQRNHNSFSLLLFCPSISFTTDSSQSMVHHPRVEERSIVDHDYHYISILASQSSFDMREDSTYEFHRYLPPMIGARGDRRTCCSTASTVVVATERASRSITQSHRLCSSISCVVIPLDSFCIPYYLVDKIYFDKKYYDIRTGPKATFN